MKSAPLQPRGGERVLIVEGWRFLAHSYAIVNQWQLLALLRRNVALKVVDVPFYRAYWQPLRGLFEPKDEQALRSIPAAQPGEVADVTLRIVAPFSFAPTRSCLTAVFATFEQQVIRRHQFADRAEYEQLRRAGPPAHVKAVTPSRWSAEAFFRVGFSPEQVLVVPHGVDVATFHPMPEVRSDARRGFGLAEGEFVFLSVGAMTGNKGIDLLLRGFAEVCQTFSHARLLLKGVDDLYGSKELLLRTMQIVSARERHRIADKVSYIGGSLSHRDMATVYQAADAYVSPYRAEGFNMPVLEATACGVPVICTAGGSTDDFVSDAFARRIASTKSTVAADGQEGSRLDPSLEHLIMLMTSAITDDAWRRQAKLAGPRHVAAHYTWDHAVDALLLGLMN
jgi:glycosyltransferase involved in cell wall biosynthesis